MRVLVAALAAALLFIPVAPASAVSPGAHASPASDFSAAKKKAMKKAKKGKAPKVEYMRAVPAK